MPPMALLELVGIASFVFPPGGSPAGSHQGANIMAAGSFSKSDSPRGVSIKGTTASNYKQIDPLHANYKPTTTRLNTNNVLPSKGGKYRGR